MTTYEGLTGGDTISGGGTYVKKHGFGHEIFNFKPYKGRYYGYGRPANDAIALERLGAPKGSSYVDGVLVVWVARPGGRTPELITAVVVAGRSTHADASE